jgi:hypothetical protein
MVALFERNERGNPIGIGEIDPPSARIVASSSPGASCRRARSGVSRSADLAPDRAPRARRARATAVDEFLSRVERESQRALAPTTPDLFIERIAHAASLSLHLRPPDQRFVCGRNWRAGFSVSRGLPRRSRRAALWPLPALIYRREPARGQALPRRQLLTLRSALLVFTRVHTSLIPIFRDDRTAESRKGERSLYSPRECDNLPPRGFPPRHTLVIAAVENGDRA